MKKIIFALSLAALVSCGMNKDSKEGNRIVVSNDKYYIYYESSVIEIPTGTYITNSRKIEDYFFNFLGKTAKDEKKLLLDLNKYFPHEIREVQIGEDNLEAVKVPVMRVGQKNIIDSIRLAESLAEKTTESLININTSSEIVEVKDGSTVDPEVSLEGKFVEILNANGINGFAGDLGKALSNNLGMKYNAENYNKLSDLSYIVNHKLTEAELNKFVKSLSIKYIKIKEDPDLKPDSDVVLITGNDSKVKFDVNIVVDGKTSELKDLLGDYKVNIVENSDKEKITGIEIKYNKEDLVIARKLLSFIPEAKLVEDNNLQNQITILSTR